MKIAWVFDLDNTLIYTDMEENKKTFFRNLKTTGIDEKMLFLFQVIKTLDYESLYILTGRHPDLQARISSKFLLSMSRVLCRKNDLERYKEKLYVKGGQELQFYFKKMNDWKVEELNHLAEDYDIVLYFDDGFNWYMERSDISNKVHILPPVQESYNNILKLRDYEE